MILCIVLLCFSLQFWMLEAMEEPKGKEPLHYANRLPKNSSSFTYERKGRGPKGPAGLRTSPKGRAMRFGSKHKKRKKKKKRVEHPVPRLRISSSSGNITISHRDKVTKKTEKGCLESKSPRNPVHKALLGMGASNRRLGSPRRKTTSKEKINSKSEKRKSPLNKRDVRYRVPSDTDKKRAFEDYGWIEEALRQKAGEILISQSGSGVFANHKLADLVASACMSSNFEALAPYLEDVNCACQIYLIGGLFIKYYNNEHVKMRSAVLDCVNSKNEELEGFVEKLGSRLSELQKERERTEEALSEIEESNITERIESRE